jgi:hypothetical protein
VRICPAHTYLEDVVKVEELYGSWHQHPAPNNGVGLVEDDFEGENLIQCCLNLRFTDDFFLATTNVAKLVASLKS